MKKKYQLIPKKMVVSAPPLYDTDVSKWAHEQAKFLKHGEWDKLDIKNLREEILGLSKSEKDKLQSHMTNWLMHKLKEKHQKKMTNSWRLTLKEALSRAKEVLDENPSLKPKLKKIFANAYFYARIEASRETKLPEEEFSEECPWSLSDIFPDLPSKYL